MRLPYVLAPLAIVACAPRGQAPITRPPPVNLAGLERPIPYPVPESPGFRRAVEQGTRTRTGRPGPKYWTQYATYSIQGKDIMLIGNGCGAQP